MTAIQIELGDGEQGPGRRRALYVPGNSDVALSRDRAALGRGWKCAYQRDEDNCTTQSATPCSEPGSNHPGRSVDRFRGLVDI